MQHLLPGERLSAGSAGRQSGHQPMGLRDRLSEKRAGSILPTWIVPEGGVP
jgi:hypothetical protein